MKHTHTIAFAAAFVFLYSSALSQAALLGANDFKALIGCWQGTLTYLDYTTNKPFSMPANLNIQRVVNTNNFIFANIYPNEPQANSTDSVSISASGKHINKELIKSRRILSDGNTEIVTELLGEDGNDNKKALFKFTYVIGIKLYAHKKEVQFAGRREWILRHEYKYEPRPCD